MKKKRIGFALCGSFCTFAEVLLQMEKLVAVGYDLFPIMSENAYQTDTRFGKANDFIWEIEDICGRKILHSIVEVEPLGPKHMIDAIIVAPCTGNTLSKLANGITDTTVTMAVKSVLRISLPVLLALATNDALAGSAQNIGRLMNHKNYYFVPMGQDNPYGKPTSLVAHFVEILPALEASLSGTQLQPILC